MMMNTQVTPRNRVAVTAAVVCAGAGVTAGTMLHQQWPIITGAAIAVYLLFAIKVIQPWERVALLRLGRYVGLRGPGMFLIVPVFETISPYVDQRVRVHSVTAESTLTRDTVPVNVDAIVFWLVWNAEKSILEVENFIEAINMSAQTALRESIGRHELAQMITERETMGHELQRILDEKTNPWGITVQSVEIRDVRIPQTLEDAMSQQAQAERERQARVILGRRRGAGIRAVCRSVPGLQRQSRCAPSAWHEHALRSRSARRVQWYLCRRRRLKRWGLVDLLPRPQSQNSRGEQDHSAHTLSRPDC